MEVWRELSVVFNEPKAKGYFISSLGRTKSSRGKNGNKFLKQIENKKGYLRFNHYKDVGLPTPFIHRLVAFAFIKNDNNFPQINHKDENKHNNRVENLEWCTQEYNVNYGNRTSKAKLGQVGKRISYKKTASVENHLKKLKEINSKKVIAEKDGCKIEFSSKSEMARYFGIKNVGSIGSERFFKKGALEGWVVSEKQAS